MMRSVEEPTAPPVATPPEHVKSAHARLNPLLSSQTWLVITFLILGGLLRLNQLGAKGLWGDEIWSAQWSRPPFVQVLINQTKPPDILPLMYGLVHISTRFGESEFWVRLPAALFGVIGLVLFYRLADLTLGRRTALVGTVLMVLSPIHIWYSQDARYYTLLCALGVASVYFFYSFITSDRVRPAPWFGFLLVTTAALYTHIFAGWIILAEGAFAAYFLLGQALRRGEDAQLLRQKARSRALWLIVALLLLALFTVPIMLGLIEALQRGTSPAGEGMASFRLQPDLPYFLTTAFFGEMVQYFSGSRIATLVVLPLFLVGLVTTWRRKRDVAVLMLCLIIVPYLTTLFLDLLHTIDFRYFFFLLPTYLLLVAEGFVVAAASLERAVGVWRQRKGSAEADRIQRRSLIGPMTLLVLLLVILLTYARPLTMVYAQAKLNDWRAIAGYLANKVQPGDVVLVERWGVDALRYYLPSTSDATVLALNPERWQRMRFLGVRTWLVGLDDEYEQQARHSFQKIGDSEWQDKRWVYGRSQQDDIYYPVTESAASIYVDAETGNSPFVDFIDINNADWTQETYRDMAPGRQITVPLTLEAVAPRVLKVRYSDYPGKEFEVSVDGQLIGVVMGGSLGGWQTWQSHLPESADDSVRVAITASGQEHVGLDWLELAYALPPASAVADYDLPIDQILDDQGAIDFDEPQKVRWTTETYRHLAPGDEIGILLNVSDQAGRLLIIRYFDLVGKSLEVRANSYLIGTITGGDRGGGWVEEQLIVPGGLGEKVLIQIQAIGPDPSGVSSLAIQPTE